MARVNELEELWGALLEAGYSVAKANGCVGFVISERTGTRVVTSPALRSQYRKMLASVGAAVVGDRLVTSPGLWASVA